MLQLKKSKCLTFEFSEFKIFHSKNFEFWNFDSTNFNIKSMKLSKC